jgi:hypothetical protein
MVEINMSKFERWINEFNPEKNSNLNAGVLLRSCTKFVKPYTLNLYHLSCFAKELAKA